MTVLIEGKWRFGSGHLKIEPGRWEIGATVLGETTILARQPVDFIDQIPRLLPGFQTFEHHTLFRSTISQLLATKRCVFPLSTFHFCLALHRVHEGTLDVIEKHDPEE